MTIKKINKEATEQYKNENFEKAVEHYYQMLSTIQLNDSLASSAAGKKLEAQTRLNIGVCKFQQKEWDMAIDQC